MINRIFAPRLPANALCSRNLKVVGSPGTEIWNAEIVIGISLHNQASSLPAALRSSVGQTVVAKKRAVVLVLDDRSTDDWQSAIQEDLNHPQVVAVEGNCGSPARARNALLDFVDEHFPCAKWVARLDADDVLVHPDAVATLCDQGETTKAKYILGSNHLAQNGMLLPWSNIANPDELKNPRKLLDLIESFALRGEERELPSCNLVLRVRSGIRYPEIRGAEDHWLVARLLIFEPSQGAIVPHPVYSTYTLKGAESISNQNSDQWSVQRWRLAKAARIWTEALHAGKEVLGVGQEGIVWKESGMVWKEFYPWAMSREDQGILEAMLANAPDSIPKPAWEMTSDGMIRCCYQEFPSWPLSETLDESHATSFLRSQLESGVIASNIKRSNLRLSSMGELIYIDIGKDIVPFTTSRFLDAAARIYGICCLGLSDHELNRRITVERQHEALEALSGFREFFQKLIESSHPHVQLPPQTALPTRLRVADQVSLLIKTCAQDADSIRDQVEHIVSQLSYPSGFAAVMLIVDPHPGPFLRQYTRGHLGHLLTTLHGLRTEGVIDEVVVAPDDPATIRSIYSTWFADDSISATHTSGMAPLFSQLWAFSQVRTRFVLQCDADVLIGRRDLNHDYLEDMMEALQADDVLGVGFNIPKASTGFLSYHASPGAFAPEIRLGLFDLERIRCQLPIENPTREGRFDLMWHRALERHQKKSGLRCLRGGDPRTFYIHPMNLDKANVDLPKIRDLIAQGVVPDKQQEKWDLEINSDWIYPARMEEIVFLLKGKDTAPEKLKRCFDSLKRQTDQDFGLIVIDDGGRILTNWQVPLLLGDMSERTTLIRRRSRYGYLPNFIEAVEGVCRNPDTLIATLDLDDALMSDRVVEHLRRAADLGADLVNGAMFRPNKPLHLYPPDYSSARKTGGGNVWAHLRAFRKSLFEKVPKDYFKLDGRWVDDVSDYALMLPMSELARSPLFIEDIYCYFHERAPYPVMRKDQQFELIAALLDKQSLRSHREEGGASCQEPAFTKQTRRFFHQAVEK